MDVGAQTVFFESLINRGTLPALERMVAFTEDRHEMLAENIANIDTPGYRTKQLDARAFQRALREALDRRGGDHKAPFAMRGTRQFRQRPGGSLEVTPTLEPTENVLFHDGTNARLERQMTDLAENAMMHQFATQMLKGRYDGMISAIRGVVG